MSQSLGQGNQKVNRPLDHWTIGPLNTAYILSEKSVGKKLRKPYDASLNTISSV